MAYWKMTDNTDELSSYDLSVQGATPGYGGILNNCYRWDGNDYLRRVNTTDFSFGSSDHSISFWINPDAIVNGQTFIAKYYGATGYREWLVGSDASGHIYYLTYQGGSAIIHYSTAVYSTTSWTHVVITKTGSTVKMYFNKNLDSTGSTASTIDSGSAYFTIGAQSRSLGAGAYYTGYIDEVSIFSIALTADNVTYLYNGGSPTSAQQFPFSGSTPTNTFSHIGGMAWEYIDSIDGIPRDNLSKFQGVNLTS